LRGVVPGVETRSCDIRDPAQVTAAIDGPLDALVANAGLGGPNEAGDGDRWHEIVETNLYGTYWCCRAAEPHLPDGGRIVVTASILARIGVSATPPTARRRRGCSGSSAPSPPSSRRARSR
jgi:NAD(P)-dependent dehydrogenase (short-subunit alcohol dehydrogenase family)